MFKAKANASKRTKNRFKEHTLVVGARMEVTGEPVTTTLQFGELKGKKCLSMQSVEKDSMFPTSPRWMGWIPLAEIEEVKEQTND